jgi:hypothetical protein
MSPSLPFAAWECNVSSLNPRSVTTRKWEPLPKRARNLLAADRCLPVKVAKSCAYDDTGTKSTTTFA